MGSGQTSCGVTVETRQVLLLAFPALILMVACGCFAGRAAGAELPEFKPALTIQVYNYRHVPTRLLVLAEREAGEVLEKAGLQVTWQDCPAPTSAISIESCGNDDRSDRVTLVVVAGPKQNLMLDTISGVALPPSLVGVFYDYLPHLPKFNDSPENNAVVMGCVMAHEIGHLLLGSRGHSISGIMQGAWGVEQLSRALMGQLVFLKEESEMMKVAAQARMKQGLSSQISAPIVRPTQ